MSQPAIYVASLAALEKLKEDDPQVVARADAAAGLSLGEYTALAFAGALKFEDGLKLVRSMAMREDDIMDGMSAGVLRLPVLQHANAGKPCSARIWHQAGSTQVRPGE